jgi:hypothetical protein
MLADRLIAFNVLKKQAFSYQSKMQHFATRLNERRRRAWIMFNPRLGFEVSYGRISGDIRAESGSGTHALMGSDCSGSIFYRQELEPPTGFECRI